MLAHHAALRIRSLDHGTQTLHIISRDEVAWVAARALADSLRAHGCRVMASYWRDSATGGVARHSDDHSDEWSLDIEDDMPF